MEVNATTPKDRTNNANTKNQGPVPLPERKERGGNQKKAPPKLTT